MDDRNHGTAGTPRTSSEEARRHYLNNGGREAQAGETVLAHSATTSETTHITGERRMSPAQPASSSPTEHVDLALGEQPQEGSGGPHVLERSFSGTYDEPKT